MCTLLLLSKHSLDSNSFTYCQWWDGKSLSGSGQGGQNTEVSCRKVPRQALQQTWCLVHASEEQGESTATHQCLGKSQENLSWSCQRQKFWRKCCGWPETHGWAGWRLLFTWLWWVYSSAQHLWESEAGRTVWTCNALVHATEEIT